LILAIEKVLDVDVRELFVSTKEVDFSDPMIVLRRIKTLLDGLDL